MSVIEAVTCRKVVTLHHKAYEFGCNWSGSVEIHELPNTAETYWECPGCGFTHTDLMPEPEIDHDLLRKQRIEDELAWGTDI